MWQVDISYIEDWLDKQDLETVAATFSALELLEEFGPALGRPLVDTLQHTRLPNLKELRPASRGNSEVRILFAFDPDRRAIMLLAGDKSRGKSGKFKWARWYKRAIPEAERIFAGHLKGLEDRP